MANPRNVHLNLGKGFEFSIAQNVGAGSSEESGLVEIALVDNRNNTWKFVPMVDWMYDPSTIDADWQLKVDVEAWINAHDLARALKHAIDYVEQIDG